MLSETTLLFIGLNSGELREINSEHIAELIFHKDGRDLVFRTISEVRLDKEIKENKFYEILIEGPYQFIKIPDKDFVEADYQRVYSPDRRYDEFKIVKQVLHSWQRLCVPQGAIDSQIPEEDFSRQERDY